MPKETILILDKEYETQWALKTLLETEKYLVIAVDSMDRVVQNFSEFEISGLITEYAIDYVCTLEKIRELKTKYPEVYVMMITNKEVRESEYEEMINAGVDDFFLKPFSIRKILPHLRKGLKQRRISLQKRRLEMELDHLIKGKRNFEDIEAGQGNRSISR